MCHSQFPNLSLLLLPPLVSIQLFSTYVSLFLSSLIWKLAFHYQIEEPGKVCSRL